VLPLRVSALLVLSGCAAVCLETASATPAISGPAGCALELRGSDASGNVVLQTVAYALDRPGLLLAPLSPAARLQGRWKRLTTLRDPGQPGSDITGDVIEVTEVLLEDAGRDLVLLRAPGLDACTGATDGDPAAGRPIHPVETADTDPTEGDTLLGLRDRDGYRPRLFQARLDRSFLLGAGGEILRLRIPDGGGAGSGFLFDRHDRLFGSILPPPPGGDRSFACAVPIDRQALELAASGSGTPVGTALARAAGDTSPGAMALLARALLLTRDDQTDQALGLLDQVARLAGESDLLLLERGGRLFRVGRTDAAIEDFSRAARISPRLFLARYNLGVAYGAAGRYEEAIESFTRALEIEPRHAQARYQLALALMAAHRLEGARRECEALEPIDPLLARDLRSVLAF
jgi:hypothetical protein